MSSMQTGCQVDFEPIGCRVRCAQGTNLLEAARAAGLTLTSVCGGEGICGQCLVRIISGAVSPPTETEQRKLGSQRVSDGFRLACLASVEADVKVDVPLASRTTTQHLELLGVSYDVPFQPAVHEYHVTLSPPTVDAPEADMTQLRRALADEAGSPVSSIDFGALRNLPGLLRSHNWQVRASLHGSEVVNLRPPDHHPLGLAVDIGTTKVAAYLVDMETGATLAVDGITNPQIAYGEDVMSRITYEMKAGAGPLTTLIRDGLNDLVQRLCPDPLRIIDAVIVGNTAMHHLFLGLPVRPLGLAPYNAVVSDPVDIKARDLKLCIAPGAYVHLLPNVAGFIGADHIAMILASGLDDVEGTFIGLDIGTNTEVVLAHRGQLLSCSTASGPAFEGAHIKHGMRAVDGAIEQVRLEGDRVEVRTINDAPPIGLCGSGVLDAIDQLRRAGLLSRRGRLLGGSGLREVNGEREFVLVPQNASGTCQAITLSEHDISEIMLAKAAIRTGINALLREAAVQETALDGIVIAGAFGTHIDVKAAFGIGMLPEISLEQIRQVGNAAGVGARMALISAPLRERAVYIASRIRYLELMVQPDFSSQFAHAMFLPAP